MSWTKPGYYVKQQVKSGNVTGLSEAVWFEDVPHSFKTIHVIENAAHFNVFNK